jgi:hypothetical protein
MGYRNAAKGQSLEERLEVGDSNHVDEKREQIDQKKCGSEQFNFSCVLRGEVKHLEKIKEYIMQEYVSKGLVNLIKPTYDKKEIYIVTGDEWEDYQKLKKRDDRLIGAWWN